MLTYIALYVPVEKVFCDSLILIAIVYAPPNVTHALDETMFRSDSQWHRGRYSKHDLLSIPGPVVSRSAVHEE